MFAQVYPAFAPITDPALNDDPGRFRNDAFLKKLYGSNKRDRKKSNHGKLASKTRWKKLQFNKNENAARQLQKFLMS